MGRYITGLVMAMVAWAACLYAVTKGGSKGAIKGDSNYFSSLARIQQTYQVDQPKIAFLGSSLTGRLPVDTFHAQAINLGCDGNSTIDSLEVFTKLHLDSVKILVLEANVLNGKVSDDRLAQAVDQTWFKAGVKYPLLSSACRPSAMLFAALKKSPTAANTVDEDELWFKKGRLTVAASQVELPPKKEINKQQQVLVRNLDLLVKRGYALHIVWLPNGKTKELVKVEREMSQSIAASLGASYHDLIELDSQALVTYSDAVHLDATSARRVARLILDRIQK